MNGASPSACRSRTRTAAGSSESPGTDGSSNSTRSLPSNRRCCAPFRPPPLPSPPPDPLSVARGSLRLPGPSARHAPAAFTRRPTAARAGRGRADPRARRQRLRAREHRLGARARPGDRTHTRPSKGVGGASAATATPTPTTAAGARPAAARTAAHHSTHYAPARRRRARHQRRRATRLPAHPNHRQVVPNAPPPTAPATSAATASPPPPPHHHGPSAHSRVGAARRSAQSHTRRSRLRHHRLPARPRQRPSPPLSHLAWPQRPAHPIPARRHGRPPALPRAGAAAPGRNPHRLPTRTPAAVHHVRPGPSGQRPRRTLERRARDGLALDPQHVWILHGRHRPTATRDPQIRWALRNAPEIGSVWDKLPRRGLTARRRARRGFHDLELSWPRELRLITGRLHGPRAQRDRVVGQLAADELRTAFTEGLH